MKKISIILAVILIFAANTKVYAAQQAVPRVVQNYTDDHAVHLFVKGIENPEEISCRFGRQVCSEIGWHTLTEAGEERETLVLIDNSLSTGRRYKEEIETLVLKLFENASENEKFSVAVFGEETEYLTEYTNLYTPLEEAVLKLEYYDRDTYMTDAILNAVDGFALEERPSVYRRVIVISDGDESDSYLHTHEELYMRLKENACPVYMIACCRQDAAASGHMNAIAQMTGAELYHIDRKSNLEEVALALLLDKDVIHITLIPDREWMDGSIINARLSFLQQGVVSGADVSIEMPFAPEDTVQQTEEVSPEPETTVLPSPSPVALSDEPEEKTHTLSTFAGGICVMIVVLLICVLIYVLVLKKKKDDAEENSLYSENTGPLTKAPTDRWSHYSNRDTQLLRSEDETVHSETTLLFEEDEVYEMTLTDQSNPSKFFSVPIKDSIIIGRNARKSSVVLDYDESVSGRHCEIENRGGRFFVRDLQSSNGTRVNGIKVISETELFSGNLLKIGGLEMKVGWSMHG